METVCDEIRLVLDEKEKARNQAIEQSRLLIRQCANTIRAVHRHEWRLVKERLAEAGQSADALREAGAAYPDVYHAGYTQDALKEYVEAHLTYAIVRGDPLPTPGDLEIEPATYLNGLAEAASELRRHILDLIRRDDIGEEAERLLAVMDAAYSLLMTFDQSDAVTGGLRRRVDQLRGVLERTRGDLTLSLRQQRLQAALETHAANLLGAEPDGTA
ncbi:MAG: haloacid dehalogenase [Anaerolineae bacterium]|nr:haloacid dehalogenase [Anaerolineae bacterium]